MAMTVAEFLNYLFAHQSSTNLATQLAEVYTERVAIERRSNAPVPSAVAR